MRDKARRAIVQYAIFRWENAIVLAGTIVLTGFFPQPFSWWPIWGWPLLGFIGIAAIFYSSLTNVETNAALLLKLSQETYDLKQIKLPELRQDVELALEYHSRIQKQVREKGEGVLWARPEDTSNQMERWVENLYRLAKRLDAYRRDKLVQNQLKTVPGEIEELASRRKSESNPIFERELDGVLESKRTQLETLQALDTRMRQAELQLAQTLSAMATVDSQVKLIDAQDVDSSRSENLRSDIREQIDRLNDLISSINEVYDYHSPGVA
jgi:hypothetical protein